MPRGLSSAPCRCRRLPGILPLSAAASCRRGEASGQSLETGLRQRVPHRISPLWRLAQPQNSSKNQWVSTIYNGGVAYPLAALYIVQVGRRVDGARRQPG